MIGSAFLTLYRSLLRHRLFAAINIGGLALGIAVFLVLFLFVRFETGFDRAWPDADRLWVVQRTLQFSGAPPVNIPSRMEMLPIMHADYPDTVGVRFTSGTVAVRSGPGSTSERLSEVDPNWFALFPSRVVTGDPAPALRTPDDAVVTQRIAHQYLRPGDPLGQTLALVIDGKPRPVRVGAVIADPLSDVSYRDDIFVRLDPAHPMSDAVSGGLTTVFRFPDAATAAARVGPFARRHPDPNFTGPEDKLKVTEVATPLTALHLANAHDRAVVVALGVVGVLALLVAAINYVNLATARAGLRARESALRKVTGATWSALVAQFMAESVATTALAALVALALVELALPLVNAAGGTGLSVRYLGRDSILLVLAALTLGLGLLAGIYPALVLARFRPAAVLAASRTPGGGRGAGRLRLLLVTGQFAIAIALTIATAVLVAQTNHLQRADLGFRRGDLITVGSFADASLDTAQRQRFAAAVAADPAVVAVTQSGIAVGGGSFGIASMHRAGATSVDPSITQAEIGPTFFPTYGARLLAGRWPDPHRFALDDPPATGGTVRHKQRNVLLNRAAVSLLGFADPAAAVGQVLTGTETDTVVGVVEDMRFGSPQVPVEATAYSVRSQGLSLPVLAARVRTSQAPATLARLEARWRQIAPQAPFRAQGVEAALYQLYYQADARRARLFATGAALSVLIGCIGLYGLAAFDTARRVREIGIRKTLGASTRDVLGLLLRQFTRPVLAANLLAWPLAFWAMRRWLAGFDDRVALSPWLFIAASLLTALVAMGAVIGQAWRVARAEPARALRSA